MWVVVLIQVLVPLLLIGIIAATRQPGRARWLVNVLSYGMVIAYMLASSRWDLSSLYLRAVIPFLFLAAAAWSWRRIRRPASKPARWKALIAWTTNLGLIVLMSGFLWFSLNGYRTPGQAVDLASPLRGNFVVLNGGASPFTNGHFRARSQSYALDILGLNALGARATWFGDSRELDNYAIWGEPVFSPCDGRVSAIVDGLPDLVPPTTDTENPAGNFVLIECHDIEVLLAHLRSGSVAVTAGQPVVTGEPIGEVGNSGNTSEPHLHIHAERGGEPGVILDGTSVPITIDGRFLVRNSILRGSAEAE